MKFHVRGGPSPGGPLTLIHLEAGDDALACLVAIAKASFETAPAASPILWFRHGDFQTLPDSKARELVFLSDCGERLSYSLAVDILNGRRLATFILEVPCSCGGTLFALDEERFSSARGESSERMLISAGARRWENRIRTAHLAQVLSRKAAEN